VNFNKDEAFHVRYSSDKNKPDFVAFHWFVIVLQKADFQQCFQMLTFEFLLSCFAFM